MENYGFKMVHITPFRTIYENLDGPHAEKYRELSTMPERIITFLNCTFAFQKIRDVDPLLVSLDRTPIKEREAEKEEAEKEEAEKEEAEKEETEKEIEEIIVEPVVAAPATVPAPAPVPEPEKKRKTRKCKETEELVDDRCLKKCEENEVRNPVTKRCNKTKKNK